MIDDTSVLGQNKALATPLGALLEHNLVLIFCPLNGAGTLENSISSLTTLPLVWLLYMWTITRSLLTLGCKSEEDEDDDVMDAIRMIWMRAVRRQQMVHHFTGTGIIQYMTKRMNRLYQTMMSPYNCRRLCWARKPYMMQPGTRAKKPSKETAINTYSLSRNPTAKRVNETMWDIGGGLYNRGPRKAILEGEREIFSHIFCYSSSRSLVVAAIDGILTLLCIGMVWVMM